MTAAPPFRRILVANRGEIAIRVIRACRELGIEPVAVYSEADARALHVRAAGRAEPIGPAPAAESYLSIDALIDAARRVEADAIHPGYGFLSESAGFARAVIDAGLVFIGPSPAVLASLGDKRAARQSVAAVGVPLVPGVDLTADASPAEALGFPLLLKAAAGGGGRGMRVVTNAGELPNAMAGAGREALMAFGDGTLYAERLLSPVRHVEVQLLGDRHGRLAVLGERECSVQRRHQKLVEESPSPAVTPSIRAALFESARRVAGTVPFHGASTVEFLLDPDGNHYFLEVNTRLQVEHGVTEMVTGLDLVAWQIRVAAGERLPEEVLAATPRGHAIQVRLYAEDPYDGFRPRSGSVTAWRVPEGPGVRVDSAIESGSELPPHYDPLLAKILVHDADRPAAVARLRRALDETLIGGIQTDLGFLHWLVDERGFVAGDYDTTLVEARWGSGPPVDDQTLGLAALAAVSARRAAPAPSQAAIPPREAAAPRGGETAWARDARAQALRRLPPAVRRETGRP